MQLILYMALLLIVLIWSLKMRENFGLGEDNGLEIYEKTNDGIESIDIFC